MSAELPIASSLDAARAVRDILLPVVTQGAIQRRPTMSLLSERLRTDERALARIRRLRDTYGAGPLLLRLPGRTIGLVLDPNHVHRLLAGTPDPFAAATTDKRGALRHFQPHAVLVTDPPLRGPRRELNEQALETHQPVHHHGHRMVEVVTGELDRLNATVGWNDFRDSWSRAVRRIVLGDKAADDKELTDLLDTLRSDANWAAFRPRNKAAYARFRQLLDSYVGAAEPASLVEGLSRDLTAELDPAGQVPHWLFAFDAAGIALWRLLCVVGARPEYAVPIAAEAARPQESPLLAHAGAAVQECLRLWPTTLVVLRESVVETEWENGRAPAGTEFVIVSSVFHRDDQALDFANRFEPEIWLDGRSDGDWPLIPFSEGPAVCPGRNVVLLTTSAAVSHVVSQYELDVDPATTAKLSDPLPATFDHTSPRIGFWRRDLRR
jgi:cytochrome P450